MRKLPSGFWQRLHYGLMTVLFVGITLAPPLASATSTPCTGGLANNQGCVSKDDLCAINGDTGCDADYYGPNACSNAVANAVSTTGGLPSAIPARYQDLLNQAAAKYPTSAQLVAAAYLTENANTWKDFPTDKLQNPDWAAGDVSGSGAKGPFQFKQGTWHQYQKDGNGDGTPDVNNMWDAAFSAANMLFQFGATPSTPLGDLTQPMKRNTLMYYAYAYNQGPTAAAKTSSTAKFKDLIPEGQTYLTNVFALISSGFTKGDHPNYGNPVPYIVDSSGNKVPDAPAPTPVAANPGATRQPVIVIDPGHSGDPIADYDSLTGLIDFDYANHPEIDDMFEIATTIQKKLTADGYKVLLTKSSVNDDVSFRDRANVANNANADLAISIHDQAGAPSAGGVPFSAGNNFVYPQDIGGYRQNYATIVKSGKDPIFKPSLGTAKPSDPPTGPQQKFSNVDAANASQTFATTIAAARAADEGHSVTIKHSAQTASDIGTRLPARGDMWMVQLFSKVPWIYNEAGGYSSPGAGSPVKHKDGLSDADKQKYATGLIDGIEKAIPVNSLPATNSTVSAICSNGVSGPVQDKITQKAVDLAWPEPYGKATGNQALIEAAEHRDNPLVATPAYLDALSKFNSSGIGHNQGADCGVFVSTVMRASGADPNYPSSGTSVQFDYVLRHPSLYQTWTSVNALASEGGSLHPGDILVIKGVPGVYGGSGHTMIYTGKRPTGYDAASASLDEREPNMDTVVTHDKRGYYLIARPINNPQG